MTFSLARYRLKNLEAFAAHNSRSPDPEDKKIAIIRGRERATAPS